VIDPEEQPRSVNLHADVVALFRATAASAGITSACRAAISIMVSSRAVVPAAIGWRSWRQVGHGHDQ
jgi:hypothetical protein